MPNRYKKVGDTWGDLTQGFQHDIRSAKELGLVIRKSRKKINFTQDELAMLVGISHVTLAKLERGESVSSDTLCRVITELGIGLVAVEPETAQEALDRLKSS